MSDLGYTWAYAAEAPAELVRETQRVAVVEVAGEGPEASAEPRNTVAAIRRAAGRMNIAVKITTSGLDQGASTARLRLEARN